MVLRVFQDVAGEFARGTSPEKGGKQWRGCGERDIAAMAYEKRAGVNAKAAIEPGRNTPPDGAVGRAVPIVVADACPQMTPTAQLTRKIIDRIGINRTSIQQSRAISRRAVAVLNSILVAHVDDLPCCPKPRRSLRTARCSSAPTVPGLMSMRAAISV